MSLEFHGKGLLHWRFLLPFQCWLVSKSKLLFSVSDTNLELLFALAGPGTPAEAPCGASPVPVSSLGNFLFSSDFPLSTLNLCVH